MADPLRAIVTEHAGRSYIQVAVGGWLDKKSIAANGVADLPPAPGDPNFFVFDGVVETLERVIPPRRITTKYQLRDDLRGAPKPEVLAVAEWQALPERDQEIYRAVVEDIPQSAEPIPFVTQREDGPPSKLPEGIVCTDRSYYARCPSFWHLGPVRATARYMLYRVTLRLREIVGSNPYIQWSHSPGDPEKDILRSSYANSVWISAKDMLVNGIGVSPKGLKSMYTIDPKDRSLTYGVIVSAINAPDLEALMAAVDAQVEQYTEHARKWVQPNACPCCKRRYAKTKGTA
jgi:hypothetical protein